MALRQALGVYPEYDVVITGHSLGAALAHFAYAELKPQPEYWIKVAYDFGKARIGNQGTADCFEMIAGATESEVGNLYRVLHANGEFYFSRRCQ